MGSHTVDTAMAKRLVASCAIQGASIIGQPGGWSVVLKLGLQEKTLGAQRSDKPRMWRSLDRCVEYLKKELHIARFDLLDATNFSDAPLTGKPREDASGRLRRAHEAAAHDNWFRQQRTIRRPNGCRTKKRIPVGPRNEPSGSGVAKGPLSEAGMAAQGDSRP